MFAKMVTMSAMLILSLSLGFTALAQQQQPTKPIASESQWVDFTGFKGKVFDLKYREPREIYETLRLLGSGYKGAEVSFNNQLKTITVRDFPENIAVIEDAIKRLDIADLKSGSSNIEFSLHVFVTSDLESKNPIPVELKDVLKQMQNTLAFKNYQLVSTITQRAKAYARFPGGNAATGEGHVMWEGMVQNPDGSYRQGQGPLKTRYKYQINTITISPNSSDTPVMKFDKFYFSFGDTSLQSEIDIRDGEKLIVGTASLNERALVLVLSARVLK